MTEISFYFNAPDRAATACRLLRKARRQGLSVMATGPDEALADLDRALWAIGPAEFIAHSWTRQAGEVPSRLHAATVWLGTEPLDAPVHDALLNLGAAPPAGFETFARLLEVVTPDEDDRSAARKRWKAYARRGYAIKRFEIGS